METFTTDRPELQPLVERVNKACDQKGFCSMHDLTGNYDTIHGLMFPTQEEADKFVDAYRVLFPLRNGKKYDEY